MELRQRRDARATPRAAVPEATQALPTCSTPDFLSQSAVQRRARPGICRAT